MTSNEFLTTAESLLVARLCGGLGAEQEIKVEGYAIVCVLNRGLPYHSHGAKKLFSAGRVGGEPVVEMVGPAVAVRRLREVLLSEA